jgi:hypothetical protein
MKKISSSHFWRLTRAEGWGHQPTKFDQHCEESLATTTTRSFHGLGLLPLYLARKSYTGKLSVSQKHINAELFL